MIRISKHIAVIGLATFFYVASFQANAETGGEMIGSWKYSCTKEFCQAYIGIAQNGDFALEWSVQRDPASAKLTTTIRVPLGAVLPPGLRVYTTTDKYFSVPFQICRSSGCFAISDIDDAVNEQMNSVGIARVTYFRQGGSGPKAEGVTFEVPIGGFADVIKKLEADKK